MVQYAAEQKRKLHVCPQWLPSPFTDCTVTWLTLQRYRGKGRPFNMLYK